jgi:hypothetical protein
VVGLDAKADLLFASPTYTFETPVLGGAQAAISAVAAVGRSEASIDATITGPRGRSFSGGTNDSLKGGSDLYLLDCPGSQKLMPPSSACAMAMGSRVSRLKTRVVVVIGLPIQRAEPCALGWGAPQAA